MPDRCSIVFENSPNGIYYTGEQVTVRIQLECTTPKTVRGVYLKFIGEGAFRSSNWRVVQRYLNKRKFVCGGAQGQVLIEPGVYVFSLKFKLPEELPTSMDLAERSVKYKVIVGICSQFWFDRKYEKEIFIIKNLDLNRDPDYRSTAAAVVYQQLWPFSSGHIGIKASIPRSGYAPDEEIFISAEVRNESDLQAAIIVQLVQISTLHSNQACFGSFAQKKSVVHQIRGRTVSRPYTTEHFRYTVIVPKLVPTNVEKSTMCSTRYVLKIVANANKPYMFKPIVRIPITIGTIGFNVKRAQSSERADVLKLNFKSNNCLETYLGHRGRRYFITNAAE